MDSLYSMACLLLGCEVAKEKLLARIDSILGEMEAKRKEVDLSVTALKGGIDGLRKAKIKVQVKQDQINWQTDPLEDRLNTLDAILANLREHLASEAEAVIGAKSYSPDELKTMAEKVLMARKELVAQIDGFQKSQASLQKIVDSLDRKQTEYQRRLTSLECQIVEIDSKAIALKAMQDASAAMGESDKTLAANIDGLEDKVNDLYAA